MRQRRHYINISYGTSESESKAAAKATAPPSSTVAAGKNLTIVATGAGQASNLTAQGANLTAGNNVTLLADNNVNLLASQSNASQESSNSSSSSSVGVSYGLISQQFSFSASASQSQGNSSGSDTTYTNTQVNAGNTASIISGGDANLIGAVVAANTVGRFQRRRQPQHRLTAIYQRLHQRAEQFRCFRQLWQGQRRRRRCQRVQQQYRQQLRLGRAAKRHQGGGWRLPGNVAGNTDLKGAVIASTQAAVDQGKNSFNTGGSLTLSDIQNSAEYKGQWLQRFLEHWR